MNDQDVALARDAARDALILQAPVKLKPLPSPDFLVVDFPQDAVCLITDVGDVTSIQLAEALHARGWPIVLLRFPSSLAVTQERLPIPPGIQQVTLADMSVPHLEQQIAALQQSYGPVGGFIHVAPRPQPDKAGENLDFETAIIRHVFLMAKYLKPALTKSARIGVRACFVAVTRLDGILGLSATPESGNASFASGGLSGLVKTLNLEWGTVFCRTIDVHPDLDAVPYIIAELHDPNRLLLEVGYSDAGRVTLTAALSEA